MEKFCLTNGRVYDPAHGVDGQIQDLWCRAGKIIAPPSQHERSEFVTVDLGGKIVFPGGVDMHSHVIGPKINLARRMSPELFAAFGLERSAVLAGGRLLPTLGDVCQRYLALGYTTVIDAAISPLASRQVHHELEHLTGLDCGFFVLVGNHHYLLEAAAAGDVERARRFLEWLLGRCGALAPKLVNPGGVENWKTGRRGTTADLDAEVSAFAVTPRKIMATIAAAANAAALPHPVHLHCNNLGFPGNWQTTLATMKELAGLKAHLAHIQFHSYGGNTPDEIRSAVDPLASHLNDHPELSVDVGQVLFGKTISLTGDGPLGHFLGQLHHRKWFSGDVEMESGCGISPIEYRDRNLLNAVQWSIGLEWFLKVQNPWQIALSTDHPNGGSFCAYPQIMALLMSAERRREMFERLPARLRERSDLGALTREYSLSEIAIVTRASPARLLGLTDKGHLGPGADADITVYDPQDDIEAMFEMPWMVIKGGEFAIRDHQWQGAVGPASTLCVDLPMAEEHAEEIAAWFDSHYTLAVERFGIAGPTDLFSRRRVGV